VGAILTAGARPTVVLRDGKKQVMSIRDVDESSYGPGTYYMTSYCAGTGQLSMSLSIGRENVRGELTCRPEVASSSLELEVAARTVGLQVAIVPQTAAEAAVSYVVRKE
jgi:hypothetical protein